METGTDVALEQKLDGRQYNDEELLSVKTSLSLPYYTPSNEFQRAYGSIVVDGVVYEYVKQRVQNDTLELLCLPNAAKTRLRDASNELTKSSADGQASAPVKKGPTVLKLSLPDFFQPLQDDAPVVGSIQTEYLLQNERFCFSDFTKCREQPPQAPAFLS